MIARKSWKQKPGGRESCVPQLVQCQASVPEAEWPREVPRWSSSDLSPTLCHPHPAPRESGGNKDIGLLLIFILGL